LRNLENDWFNWSMSAIALRKIRLVYPLHIIL
jgi:hypothetical protein